MDVMLVMATPKMQNEHPASGKPDRRVIEWRILYAGERHGNMKTVQTWGMAWEK